MGGVATCILASSCFGGVSGIHAACATAGSDELRHMDISDAIPPLPRQPLPGWPGLVFVY